MRCFAFVLLIANVWIGSAAAIWSQAPADAGESKPQTVVLKALHDSQPAPSGAAGKGTGKALWQTVEGRKLKDDDLRHYLSLFGVRKIAYRTPGSPYSSTTQLKVLVGPGTLYEDLNYLGIVASLSHIGIERLSLALQEDAGTEVSIWSLGEPVLDQSIFTLPRLLIKRPGASRTGADKKDKPSLFTLSRPRIEVNHETDALSDLVKPFDEISKSKLNALVISVQGPITCGEIFAAIRAARSKGIKTIGLQGGFAAGRGFTITTLGFGGSDDSVTSDDQLNSSARSSTLSTVDAIKKDGLWLTPESSKLPPIPHAWDRFTASALAAWLFVYEGEYDDGARNEKKIKKVFAKLSAGVTPEGAHTGTNDSLFAHAWMTLCFVRAWGYSEPTELESCLPRMLQYAGLSELPKGGWPARKGGSTPDLLTSAMMAIALKEGIEAELISATGSRAKKLAWLDARTDSKTGLVACDPPVPRGAPGLSRHSFDRLTGGIHPEFETAAAVACQMASGRPAEHPTLARQISRLKTMLPKNGFGLSRLDIEHAHLVAWIMSEQSSADWVPMRRELGNALLSFMESAQRQRRLTAARKNMTETNRALIPDLIGNFCAHQLTQFGVTVDEEK